MQGLGLRYSPKSTLWNLNTLAVSTCGSVAIQSEIYLVEFKPTLFTWLRGGAWGPKSTLWNLNEDRLRADSERWLWSEIYLVEFKLQHPLLLRHGAHQSEIYLVEFKQNSRVSRRYCRVCPKSTLWNLNPPPDSETGISAIVRNLPCGI